MQIIAGKTVLTTLAEIVDPRRAAVLVVDVQNGYFEAGSIWLKERGDSMLPRTLAGIGRLVVEARRASVPVIYIRMVTYPGLDGWSPAYTRFMILKNRLPVEKAGTAPDSWEAQIVPAVAPQPGELVIEKFRSSGFVGTNLEMVLRSRGRESVIVCGVATHACVESTIRDAFNKDFYVVEVEDCVGAYETELHQASLTVMRSRIEVVGLDAVVEAWGGRRQSSG
jgi:nicotinamidase-related amidase